MAIYHFHIDLNIVHLLTVKHFSTVIPRGTEHAGDVNFWGGGVNKVHYDIWDNGE